MGSESLKTMFEKINQLFFILLTILKEIHRLFPDSILFISLLMFIITGNTSFGAFVFFLVEVILARKIIHGIYTGIYGPLPPITKDNLECISGFRTHRVEVERILTKTFPSISILTLFAIGGYIASSMAAFKETMDTMGTGWSIRYTVSIILTSLLVTAIVINNIWIQKCDSKSNVILAVFLGIALGIGGYYLNNLIFGIESENLLGLPLLVDRASEESAIYACAPEM